MIAETRYRLREWGNWARGGLPTIGSMFRALFGGGGGAEGEMPTHIQQVDIVVCRAQPEYRIVLIKAYASDGTQRSKARSLGYDVWTFRRKLDLAEWYVNAEL